MALRFAEEGAVVAVNYLQNSKAAEEVCGTITDAGGKAISIQADVADRSQVERMVETTLKQFSKIDILVNNAGFLKGSPLLEIPADELDRMIDVNLKGVLHCVRAVAKIMIANRYAESSTWPPSPRWAPPFPEPLPMPQRKPPLSS